MGTVERIERRRSDRSSDRRPTLALIAHDGRKDELLRLARTHHADLRGMRLVATRGTGQLVSLELDTAVECVTSGGEGGDMEIRARVVVGEIDGLVFLRDPVAPGPHEPDFPTLIKVCDVHEVPAATNCASAEILIRHLAARRGAGRVSHPSSYPPGRFPWGPARSRSRLGHLR